jgi:hypothetical protein
MKNGLPIDSVTGQPFKEAQQTPGVTYIHEKTGQLRYSNKDGKPLNWIQPMPVHKAGQHVRFGQPVSIAFSDEIASTIVQASGEPAVVPSNPRRHQIASGIAMNPGDPTQYETSSSTDVHILTNGQIEYDKTDKRFWDSFVAPDSPLYYMPPHGPITGSGANRTFTFDWNHDDIGKAVYVDGRIGHEGELTIKIEEAYADGANICTIGRLADAPRLNSSDPKIVIDVQITGDSRGLIDSTQFDVVLEDIDSIPNPGQSEFDKIVVVKCFGTTQGTRGKIILSDTDLTVGGDGSPIGAFIAKAGVNYRGQTIVAHRLGIIEGNFPYQESDVGRELQLNNGQVSSTGGSTSYDYKVGVVLGIDRALIDCRFIRMFKKFAPIGDMKPIYQIGPDGPLTPITTFVEPGYIMMDPADVWAISNGVNPAGGKWPSQYYELVKVIMYKNMAKFYRDAAGTNEINIYTTGPSGENPWTPEDLRDLGAFFRFEYVYYTIGTNKLGTQIKYATEGAPDKLEVLWPYKTFQLTLDGRSGGKPGASNVRLNITDLVNLGSSIAKDDNTFLVDDYEISVVVGNPQDFNVNDPNGITGNDTYLSPGFYTKSVVETFEVNYYPVLDATHSSPYWDNDLSHFSLDANGVPMPKQMTTAIPKICGFEWRVYTPASAYGLSYYLEMVTNPSQTSTEPGYPGNFLDDDIFGICYPAGVPLEDRSQSPKWDKTMYVTVVVRRRPTQYHDLYLNQLYENSTWNTEVWSDGNGTIGLQRLAFGPFTKLGQEPVWRFANEYTIDPSPVIVEDYNGNQRLMIEEKRLLGDYLDPATQLGIAPNILRQIYKVKSSQQPAIRMDYDFDIQLISSNALMAFKYYSPSTNFGDLTAAVGAGYTNITYFYNPVVHHSVAKNRDYGHEAMKSVYELPVGVFNYKDDTNAQIQEGARLSPYSRQIESTYNTANNPNVDFHNYYLSSFIPRYIWKDVPGMEDQLSLSYIYNNDEIADIIKDRASTYGSRFESQSIQSNIGLLIQSTQETQERLLKIERTMFGADAESIPGDWTNGYEDILDIKTLYGPYTNSVTNYGSARLAKALIDLRLIFAVNRENPSEPAEFWSFWDNVLTEVLGWKDVTEPTDPYFGTFHNWKFDWIDGIPDLPPFNTSKLSSGLKNIGTEPFPNFEQGNVSDVWFWLEWMKTDYNGLNNSVNGNIPNPKHKYDSNHTDDKVKNSAWMRADHVYLKRSYDLEHPYLSLNPDGFTPYPSRTGSLTNSEALNLVYGNPKDDPTAVEPFVEYLIYSDTLGHSDISEESETKSSTVSNQSVEGLMYDLAIRAVALKSLFELSIGTLKSPLTMYSLRPYSNDIGALMTRANWLKTPYPDLLNFQRTDLFTTAVGVKYYNDQVINLKNRFVTAEGYDDYGKIAVQGALIFKGLIPNSNDRWEYLNARSTTRRYDSINLFDKRASNIKETHIPIRGRIGNRVPKYLQYYPGVTLTDPDILGTTDWSKRPSFYELGDLETDHPNVFRYYAESVLTIPNKGPAGQEPYSADTPASDKELISLKFKPEWKTRTFNIVLAGPEDRVEPMWSGIAPASQVLSGFILELERPDEWSSSGWVDPSGSINYWVSPFISGRVAPGTYSLSGNYGDLLPNYARYNESDSNRRGWRFPVEDSNIYYKQLFVSGEVQVQYLPKLHLSNKDFSGEDFFLISAKASEHTDKGLYGNLEPVLYQKTELLDMGSGDISGGVPGGEVITGVYFDPTRALFQNKDLIIPNNQFTFTPTLASLVFNDTDISGSDITYDTVSGVYYDQVTSGFLYESTTSGTIYDKTSSGSIDYTNTSGTLYEETASGTVYSEVASGTLYKETASGVIYNEVTSGEITSGDVAATITIATAAAVIDYDDIAAGLSTSGVAIETESGIITVQEQDLSDIDIEVVLPSGTELAGHISGDTTINEDVIFTLSVDTPFITKLKDLKVPTYDLTYTKVVDNQEVDVVTNVFYSKVSNVTYDTVTEVLYSKVDDVSYDKTVAVEYEETAAVEYDKTTDIEHQRIIAVEYDKTTSVEYQQVDTVEYEKTTGVEYNKLIGVEYDKTVIAKYPALDTVTYDKTNTVTIPTMDFITYDKTREVVYEKAVDVIYDKIDTIINGKVDSISYENRLLQNQIISNASGVLYGNGVISGIVNLSGTDSQGDEVLEDRLIYYKAEWSGLANVTDVPLLTDEPLNNFISGKINLSGMPVYSNITGVWGEFGEDELISQTFEIEVPDPSNSDLTMILEGTLEVLQSGSDLPVSGTVYGIADPDTIISGFVDNSDAVDTNGFVWDSHARRTLEDRQHMQQQWTTIPLNALRIQGNKTIEYPNTATLPFNQTIIPGRKHSMTTRQKEANLMFGTENCGNTFEELLTLWKSQTEPVQNQLSTTNKTRYTSLLDTINHYLSKQYTDALRTTEGVTAVWMTIWISQGLASAFTSIAPGSITSGQQITARINEINAANDSTWRNDLKINITDTGNKIAKEDSAFANTLEIHSRAMMDGTSMPEISLWVDIPNAELNLTFLNHINKVMTLAVQTKKYSTKTEGGQTFEAYESPDPWPWELEQPGYAKSYPLTQQDERVLMPDSTTDLWNSAVSVPLSFKTIEDLGNESLGININTTISWYGSTIGSHTQYSSLDDGSSYLDANMTTLLTSATTITPAMKIWRTSWLLGNQILGNI